MIAQARPTLQLDYEPVTLTLAAPFSTHHGTVSQLRHLFVRLRWQEHEGVGVAVPTPAQSMTRSPLLAALEEYAPLIAESSPFGVEQLLRRLEAHLPGQPAARAAIDMAIHDLMGKLAGVT